MSESELGQPVPDPVEQRREVAEDPEAPVLPGAGSLPFDVNEADAVYAELKPGQASLHHVLLFHGSAPNRSDDRRIGLAIRYIPTHVRQAVGSRDWATLVRGVDTHGYFEPEPRPARDLDPAALAFHKQVSEEQVRVLYRGTDRQGYRP